MESTYPTIYYLLARLWNGCTSAVEGLLRSLPQVCWAVHVLQTPSKILRSQKAIMVILYEEPRQSSSSDSALIEPDSIDPTSDMPTVVDTHRFYSPDEQGNSRFAKSQIT